MKKVIALLSLIFSSLLPGSSLLANPGGENIVAGDVSLKTEDKTLIINASDRSIVDWQNFSIAQDETTKFVQPATDATCLNRVVGNLSSEILGKLESNGTIFLINPNGIIVGSSGVVDTGSFIASTLNVSNEDFLDYNESLKKETGFFKKSITFKGEDGKQILNEGQIITRDGDLLLLAPQIKNKGTLQAKDGDVMLMSGKEIFFYKEIECSVDEAIYDYDIDEYGPKIRVKCPNPSIESSGKISAESLLCFAETDNPEALAINISGSVECLDDSIAVFSSDKGKVNLDGNIQAPNGAVVAFGGDITVAKNANIDVSDDFDGGVISLGNPNMTIEDQDFTATKSVTIEKGAQLKANTLKAGDGGSIFVTSADKIVNDGNIFATGGKMGGDGGAVFLYSETKNVSGAGNIDVSATNGEEGIVFGK